MEGRVSRIRVYGLYLTRPKSFGALTRHECENGKARNLGWSDARNHPSGLVVW